MGVLEDFDDDENYNKIVELQQMKQCLCKIENNNGKGAGFFCTITYQQTNLYAMITTNHLINDKIIKNDKVIEILLNDDDKDEGYKALKINGYRKIYTSLKYDITIVEINPDSDDIHKFLKIDENIFKENISYENIFIIQYIQNNNIINLKKLISKGLINEINCYNIKYTCNSSHSLPGCPLLNSSNNKIIGIHKETLLNFNNRGIFLKEPLNIYINDILNISKKNEINMKLKIEKEDINTKIYFLYGKSKGIIAFSNNGNYSSYTQFDSEKTIKEINKSNVELYINNIKYDYFNCFIPNKEGIYEVKLKFLFKIKDCSKLFLSCDHIISIDLSFFDSSLITDVNNMFSGCTKLEKINFSSFDTKNVTNMENMFYDCENLIDINLSFFNTRNVISMSHMFSRCYNLRAIYLSSFDTQNVTNMGSMFSNCQRLIYLDLSSFDTQNVTNMNSMFLRCYSLIDINLTSFNTINVNKNIHSIFEDCYNLPYIDLSSFTKITRNHISFINCINLLNTK